MRGEAGIGRTTLLRYAARQASGFRVAQVTGVEAEMELPFAGVHQLCAPLLDQLDASSLRAPTAGQHAGPRAGTPLASPGIIAWPPNGSAGSDPA
jgi:hypothetical protein